MTGLDNRIYHTPRRRVLHIPPRVERMVKGTKVVEETNYDVLYRRGPGPFYSFLLLMLAYTIIPICTASMNLYSILRGAFFSVFLFMIFWGILRIQNKYAVLDGEYVLIKEVKS